MLAWLRRLHRWIGLAAVLPMLLLGVTGAVLTLEPVWPHGHAASLGAPRSDSAILAAATALAPPGARPARYSPAGAPGEAAAVAFGGRNALVIRIDPVTLAPIGTAEGQGGVLRTMRALHVNLMLPELGGRSIIGWCGVALVLLTVLGIPLWWPRPGQWRAAFTFSASTNGVRFHRRLHGAVGIWIALVLFVNALTGAMLGFPQMARGWMGLQAGGPPRPGPPPGPPPAYDLDAAMALARTALPGARPRFVILPMAAGAPFRVFLGAPGGGAARSGTAAIDAAGTRLLSLQDPAGYTLAERLWRWAHDLHEGAGAGPVWRGLTFLAGAALPVFSVTGLAMWLLRRRRRRRLDLARQAAIQPGD
jgi:uncharacterized iron-regulated membrane protein